MNAKETNEKYHVAWETGPVCKDCGHRMRSQGCTWVDPHVFYFYLKCGYCSKRLKGKKRSAVAYVVDWLGWDRMKAVPARSRQTKMQKKYMTARRKKG